MSASLSDVTVDVKGGGKRAQRRTTPSLAVNAFAETSLNIFPGTVTTTAGNGTVATVDGLGTQASFQDMGGVISVGGATYVATLGSIRKVDASGNVTTLAGDATDLTHCIDGATGATSRFQNLNDIDSDGTYLYVAEGGTGCAGIRRVALSNGATTLVAGYPSPGLAWHNLTLGPDGYIYAARCCNTGVDRINIATGAVTLNWLSSVTVGGISHQLVDVAGLAADSQNLWIATSLDNLNGERGILRIGFASPSTDSTWYAPPGGGVSLIGAGQLVSAGNYLYGTIPADDGVERITKKTGAVGGIAGSIVDAGDLDGQWAGAKLNNISGLASDGQSLWVADGENHKFKQISFAPLLAREFGPESTPAAATPRAMSGDPVDTASGNFSESFTDISLPGIGIPFTFTRYYNSLNPLAHASSGRFGTLGWSDTFDVWIDDQDGGGKYLVHLGTGGTLRYDISLNPVDPGTYDVLTKPSGLFRLTQPDGTRYDFDSQNRLSTITDRTGHSLTLTWNAGQLDFVTDSVGRVIDFQYGAPCGFLTRISLPDGRYVEYAYNTSCQLDTVYELDSDGLNRKFTHYSWVGSQIHSIDHDNTNPYVTNTYDGAGRVYQQQLSGITTTTYTYDPVNGTTTATRNQHAWTYTYALADSSNWAKGDLKSVMGPSPQNRIVSYTSYQAHQPQTVTGNGNQTWAYTYNSVGAVRTITPPIASADVTYNYDPNFPMFPTSMTDGNGNITRWIYDATSGDLQCEILPTSVATTCNGAATKDKIVYAYDANHQVHTVTAPHDAADPNAHITTYDYFASGTKKGLLQAVTTPEGLKTSFDYNAFSQMSQMTTPQGNVSGGGVWNYTYDDAGRTLTITDPLPTHPLGFTTKFDYDAEGNVVTKTDADGHLMSYGFLPGGIPCYTSRSAAGTCASPPSTATSYTYDADGNLWKVTDGAVHTTAYTYWQDGELKTVTDPLLPARVWSYGTRSYTSTNSTLVETLNSGDTVTSTNDAMDRLITVAYSTPTGQGLDVTPTAQYAYDDNSNLCYASTGGNTVNCGTPSGGTKLTYDQLNRLVTAEERYVNPTVTFSYAYDNAGNLKSRTSPDSSKVAYTYDADNRLCGIVFDTVTPASSCLTGTVKFDYTHLTDPNAQLIKTFPNGKTFTSLDTAGRTTKIQNQSGATLTDLSVFTTTLSPAGYPQTTTVFNNGLPTGLKNETQTYTFDSVSGRLQKVCYDASGACSNTNMNMITGVSQIYDGAGNTTSKTTYGLGAGTTYYGYDEANELCWAGSFYGSPSSCNVPGGDNAYTYTANGDRRTYQMTTLRYDLAHRLTKATQGSVVDTYSYDPLGNRSKDIGASTTTYDWDPNGSVAQLASAKVGSTQKDFFSGGGLQAMKQGNSTYYYDVDQTGSVANILKMNGTLEYSYSYEPYGKFRSNNKNDSGATTNFNPMGFDSEYADLATTGFVDLRARMYDPAKGSFLTSDPAGRSPDYTFAAQTPTMFNDPTGMSVCGGSCWDLFKLVVNPSQWRQDFDASSHGDRVAGVVAEGVVITAGLCFVLACAAIAGAGAATGVTETLAGTPSVLAATLDGAGVGALSGGLAYGVTCTVQSNCTLRGLAFSALGGAITGGVVGWTSAGASLWVGAASGFIGGSAATTVVVPFACGRAPSAGEVLSAGAYGGLGGAAGSEFGPGASEQGAAAFRGFIVDSTANMGGSSC